MKAKAYLCLAVLGTILPLSVFAPFIFAYGFDAGRFFQQLWQTPASRFFVLDVLISALTLLVFVSREGRRLNMERLWVYLVCTLLVGVSLALPLFLFFRERRANEVGTLGPS
jgi:hypothetical protein